MRTILVGACLSVALDAAAPLCALAADDWPLPHQRIFHADEGGQRIAPSLLFLDDGPQAAAAPTYAAGMRFELRYHVESSDGFDPTNLKVFGGAIGGSGVKGGAVVSLSWPTEH